MVKNIIKYSMPLLLLTIGLILYPWSQDTTVILWTITIILFAISAGISISHMIDEVRNDSKKK